MSKYELQLLLEKSGLREREAMVYLASLELGSSPVSVIAKRAKTNRCTTYNVLERLTGKGLVRQFIKNDTRFYIAEEPLKLLKYLRKKRDYIDDQVGEMREKLYEFEKIKNMSHSAPKVTLLEGHRSIENIYEEMGKPENKVLTISSMKDAKELSQKTLRLKQLKVPLELNIYDNKIAIIPESEEYGIIIKSFGISEMWKEIFTLLWQTIQVQNKRSHRSIQPGTKIQKTQQEAPEHRPKA